jgi:hypothetical protein
VLLGETGMNAGCGADLADGTVLWSTYNPVVGGKWAPHPGAPDLWGRRDVHEPTSRVVGARAPMVANQHAGTPAGRDEGLAPCESHNTVELRSGETRP